MKTINLGQSNSILNRFIAELRDKSIQKDSMRFRRNLERIGEIFAYEISKTLNYSAKEVTTPLGIANCSIPDENMVLATILRAGVPLHNGLLNIFDKAQNAFVAAYRKYGKDNKFTIQIEYISSPSIEGKILVIADSMLATGSSLVLAYEKLCEKGEPAHTHIVCPIASEFSLGYLSKHLPHKKVTLWVAAVDEELTNKSFIVPGIGDAGDLNIDNGVYLSHVEVEGKCYKAMSNVGCRPSVDGTTRLLETHLFDFEGDLYGKTITVKLLRKIRDEKRFTSIEALQQQLKSDAEICQQ